MDFTKPEQNMYQSKPYDASKKNGTHATVTGDARIWFSNRLKGPISQIVARSEKANPRNNAKSSSVEMITRLEQNENISNMKGRYLKDKSTLL